VEELAERGGVGLQGGLFPDSQGGEDVFLVLGRVGESGRGEGGKRQKEQRQG